MKIIPVALVMIAAFLFSGACFAANLAEEDFTGAWSGGSASLSGELDSLDIGPEGTAHFTRRFPDLNREKTSATPLEITRAQDLLVIQFRDDKTVKYRIILSGWKNGQEKTLFGTMYTYDDGKLVSIVPVSFNTVNP